MSSEKWVTSPKTFCWPVSELNFACIDSLNFDKSWHISSFAITTQVIILSGSHWKTKYSTTLILVKGLVKGKRLLAGESSKAFTFARKCHRNQIKILGIARTVQTVNCLNLREQQVPQEKTHRKRVIYAFVNVFTHKKKYRSLYFCQSSAYK